MSVISERFSMGADVDRCQLDIYRCLWYQELFSKGADADRYQAPSTIYLHNYGMVTLYMLDAVDIKIDIIDINRYLKYIIDINDIMMKTQI